MTNYKTSMRQGADVPNYVNFPGTDGVVFYVISTILYIGVYVCENNLDLACSSMMQAKSNIEEEVGENKSYFSILLARG